MSISSVNAMREKKATATPEGLTYVRRYRVATDDSATTEKEILEDSRLPAFYSELAGDRTVTCKRRAATQNLDNLLEWIVTCDYTTRTNDEGEPGSSKNKPTDELPKITFGFARYVVPVYMAYKEEGETRGSQSIPVRNSAGDPFDPGITEEKSNLLITIIRNETARDFTPATPLNFIGTINKSKILIAGINFGPRMGLMRDIGSMKMWDFEGDPYYQVTYQIEGDPEGHVKKIIDQGFYALISEKKIKLKGKDMVPNADDVSPDSFVTEPQLLDLAGGLYTPTDDVKSKIISFYTKYESVWKSLGLPDSY